MRKGTYLNFILTANAVLLAALVWVQLIGHAPLVQTAEAQSTGGGGSTMVNAADQRQRMIESLRDIRQSVNETNRLLERNTMRVHVVNLADLQPKGE